MSLPDRELAGRSAPRALAGQAVHVEPRPDPIDARLETGAAHAGALDGNAHQLGDAVVLQVDVRDHALVSVPARREGPARANSPALRLVGFPARLHTLGYGKPSLKLLDCRARCMPVGRSGRGDSHAPSGPGQKLAKRCEIGHGWQRDDLPRIRPWPDGRSPASTVVQRGARMCLWLARALNERASPPGEWSHRRGNGHTAGGMVTPPGEWSPRRGNGHLPSPEAPSQRTKRARRSG